MAKIDFSNYFSEFSPDGETAMSYQIKRKLHEEQTPFQFIEVFETTKFGYLLAIDGSVQLTTRDNFIYHEMMTHPVLFTHPNPKRVAIIGGGDCGALHEALKHPDIEKIWQIDIDRRVTELSQEYFPELCATNKDPRAELLFIDGLKWMKEVPAGSLDVIIVDSTDPVGPAVGLFGTKFVKDCFKALSPKGILLKQSESPLFNLENIIIPTHESMKESGFQQTLSLYFPQPTYPSGWWTCTMASKDHDLTFIREEDIINKTFTTRYYNDEIHHAAMAAPEFMQEALRKF
jgi:spermidine synthase